MLCIHSAHALPDTPAAPPGGSANRAGAPSQHTGAPAADRAEAAEDARYENSEIDGSPANGFDPPPGPCGCGGAGGRWTWGPNGHRARYLTRDVQAATHTTASGGGGRWPARPRQTPASQQHRHPNATHSLTHARARPLHPVAQKALRVSYRSAPLGGPNLEEFGRLQAKFGRLPANSLRCWSISGHI